MAENPRVYFAVNPSSTKVSSTRDLERQSVVRTRLILQDIYQVLDAKQARSDLKSWCQWVKDKAEKADHQLLEPMVRVARMVERHLQGILGHWKKGLTTAFLEGLNSLFSSTKRKARDYRNTKNLLTMLYFVAGKLRIPCY
jgi:transposase